MAVRPYLMLSCAMSLDGYIDDGRPDRLILSNDADLDRVDEVRASVDAILVGAGTIRRDDPRLLVRSPQRRADRTAQGRPPSPVKVTITASGDLDPRAQFFTAGDAEKIVYVVGAAGTGPGRSVAGGFGAGGFVAGGSVAGGSAAARERLRDVATVVQMAAGDIGAVFDDLAARGIRSVLVEGGSAVLTECLRRELFDELQVVVAPFFVGEVGAPRFVGAGPFPYTSGNRLRLIDAAPVGDCVLLTYAPPGDAV
jgi:riboflavin biosynthesis pyrimidine reductase